MIRVCALMLAIVLLFTCPIVALAGESIPPETTGAPHSEAETSPMESTPIGLSSITDGGEPPTGDKVPWETPAPDLSGVTVELKHLETGWKLAVIIPHKAYSGAQSIFPEYSFDQTAFLPVVNNDGTDVIWDELPEAVEGNDLEKHIDARTEPMKSFINKQCDSFTFRLRFEGVYNGYSPVYSVERTTKPQPTPEDSKVLSALPAVMEVKTTRPPSQRGLYNVTVQEGTTGETVSLGLPDELTLNVQLQTSNHGVIEFLVQGTAPFGVDWDIPSGAVRTGILKNAVKLTPPQGEAILQGEFGSYILPQIPPVQVIVPDPNAPGEFIWVDEPFDLSINVIPANEKAAPQLGMNYYNTFGSEMFSLSMPYKPSGAKSIVAEYSLDGGASWLTVERTDGNNLVALGYPPDMVPKQPDYGAPLFFDNDKTPMKEYLADNSKGFLVRFQIDGGVYDGVSEVLPWPSDYKFDPPTTITPGPGDGGEGNRGDVGSDDDGGSAFGGGQRPNLPTAEQSDAAAQKDLLSTAPLMPLATTPDPTPAQAPDVGISSAPPLPAPEQDDSGRSFATESAVEAIAPLTGTPRETDNPLSVPIVAAVALLGGGAAVAGLASANGAGRMSGFIKSIKALFHK